MHIEKNGRGIVQPNTALGTLRNSGAKMTESTDKRIKVDELGGDSGGL